VTNALDVLHELVSAGFGLVPMPDHGLRITRPAGSVLAPVLRDAVDHHRVTLRPWVDPVALRNRLRLPVTVPIDPQLAVILAWLAGFRDTFRSALYNEFRDEYTLVRASLLHGSGDDPPVWFLSLETIERVAVRHLPVASAGVGWGG
jgi:hypothetical protein